MTREIVADGAHDYDGSGPTLVEPVEVEAEADDGLAD